jgi:hypothetical protein
MGDDSTEVPPLSSPSALLVGLTLRGLEISALLAGGLSLRGLEILPVLLVKLVLMCKLLFPEYDDAAVILYLRIGGPLFGVPPPKLTP